MQYLSVKMAYYLRWNAHIDNITTQVYKSLGFIRRYLHARPEDIINMAVRSLVRLRLLSVLLYWIHIIIGSSINLISCKND